MTAALVALCVILLAILRRTRRQVKLERDINREFMRRLGL